LATIAEHWNRDLHDEDGTFKIKSRTSSFVIDAQAVGGVIQDNAALQLYADTGNPNQRWRIVDTGDGDGPFFIMADDTQEVWDVENASRDDGALIQLFGLHRGDKQRWLMEQIEVFEAFQIRSPASNLALDLPGFSQDIGKSIQQWDSNGGFNQLWQKVLAADGRNKIRCACSGQILDYTLQFALANQPAIIGQEPDNGGSNQEWFINTVGQDGFGRDIVSIVSAVNGFFLNVPHPLNRSAQSTP
jgi:hypothetical protein